LVALFPDVEFIVHTMDTVGDKVLDVALANIGDKGLFTKDLEMGMLSGSIDMAVHSLKDMPTRLPQGLTLGAITKREDPHDALVLHPKYPKGFSIDQLPPGSVIGTSSLRRIAQLKYMYPLLQFKDMRGNLNTRLRKLDEGNEYDALILAVAGLQRLRLGDRISQVLPYSMSLYAVGQGALAVECKEEDSFVKSLLENIHHVETALCCMAERALLRELEGGCHVPIGVQSIIHKNDKEEIVALELEGAVLSLEGDICIRERIQGTEDFEKIGIRLASILKSKGADAILEDVKNKTRKKSTINQP